VTDIADLQIITVPIDDDLLLGRFLSVRNEVDTRPLTLAGYRAEAIAARVHHELLASIEGQDVGAAVVAWGEISIESKTIFIDAWVLATHRRLGVGTRLVDRCMAFARDAGMVTARTYVLEVDDGSVAFATRYGMVVTGGGQLGWLDLTEAHRMPVSAPEGIEITTWAERPDLEREVFDLFALVRPEVPTLALEPEPSFEAWHRELANDPGFAPGLSVLALRDGRVVGSLIIFDNDEGNAFIGMTAVHPDARRQGIARALKTELAARAVQGGFRRIETYNDGTNERMRGLNLDLGYQYQPRHLSLKGPLPEA